MTTTNIIMYVLTSLITETFWNLTSSFNIKDDEIEVEVGKETGDASESYYAKFTIGDGVQLDKFDLCIYTEKPFTND